MSKIEKFGLVLILVSDIAQNINEILGLIFFITGLVLFVCGDDLKVDT